MVKLGDFIGALLADIGSARVRADIEALKLAEIYSNHELLRHMPVPHFRLPDITVDINVLLDDIETQTGADAGAHYQQPSAAEITKVIRRSFAETGMTFNVAERKQVYSAAQRKSRSVFERPAPPLINMNKANDAITAAAEDIVTRILKSRGVDDTVSSRFVKSMKGALRELMLGKITRAPALKVGVNSAEVKEHGDPNSLVRIHLTISEDSYEIVADAPDTSSSIRLVPE